MSDLIKVEILVSKDWILTEMKNLKKDDVFRMTEPDEVEPFGTWVATKDAEHIYPGENGGLVWGIGVDHYEMKL